MNTERFGEIKEITNEDDYNVAKCSIAVLDEVLNRYFLLENVLINVTPRAYTVSVTLDIPSEFYYDTILDGKNDKFDYTHLKAICEIAESYKQLKEHGLLLAEAYNERDRLRSMIHEYERRE